MKKYTLDELIDEIIGRRGTPKRDEFEAELKRDLKEEETKQSKN